MWPQQNWGQRSSRGQWPLVQVFEERVTVFTYFDVFSWDDTMILGWSHTCDLNRSGVKGHLGVIDLLVKFLKNSHCFNILWCITMGVGLILQWLPKYVIAKAGEALGLRTALLRFSAKWFLLLYFLWLVTHRQPVSRDYIPALPHLSQKTIYICLSLWAKCWEKLSMR